VWHGPDRWKRLLIFPQSTFDHAVERGHFTKTKGTFAAVTHAFQFSTLVLSNEESTVGTRVWGTERVCNELYVGTMPGDEPYLLVPVIVQTVPFSGPGMATIAPPVRIAASAYLSAEIPDQETLLQWPPKPTK
jgi:hypothetical protein